jgi:hypothetical protein
LWQPRILTGQNLHLQDFAVLAFDGNLERTAADFAIRGEPLAGEAGINTYGKGLTAEGALDVREFFHGGSLNAFGQSAIRGWSENHQKKQRLTA